MTWAHGDPDAVVRTVLADSAYRSAPATTARKPHESLLATVLRWLYDHVLVPLFHPLARAFGASREAGTVLGFVLVAIAIAGLAFVVFRLAVAFARGPSRAGTGRAGDALADSDPSARDWRAFARAAAQRGEYARAIAALFAAALAELDERAIVAFDAARTPGEYRRSVRRARANASAPFDDLTDRFVRASYGPAAPAPAEYEAAERALAAFEPALAS